MPCRPSAPILGHSSRGKRSVLSSSAAIGATSTEAKRRPWSRSASAVSPRPKSNDGIALGIMILPCLLLLNESGRRTELHIEADELPFAVRRNEAELEVDPRRVGREEALDDQLAVAVDRRHRTVGRFHRRDDVDVDALGIELLERLLELFDCV